MTTRAHCGFCSSRSKTVLAADIVRRLSAASMLRAQIPIYLDRRKLEYLVREQVEIALTDAAPKAPRKARQWRCHHPLGQWTRPESEIDDDCKRCHHLKRVAANAEHQARVLPSPECSCSPSSSGGAE